MDSSFFLCGWRPFFKAERAFVDTFMKFLDTFKPEFLKRMQQTLHQILNKVYNGTLIDNRAGYPLCDLYVVFNGEIPLSAAFFHRLM